MYVYRTPAAEIISLLFGSIRQVRYGSPGLCPRSSILESEIEDAFAWAAVQAGSTSFLDRLCLLAAKRNWFHMRDQ